MGIKEDKKEALNLCQGKTNYNAFEKIYVVSNERVDLVFSGIDFREKEVLSVLSSADHVFSEYFLGALRVDTFDINQLTKYYYYLRKWYLVYTGIDIPYGRTNEELLGVLELVEGKSPEEIEALSFWRYLGKRSSNVLSNGLFTGGVSTRRNVPYMFSLDKLCDDIKDKEVNFTKLDMFRSFDMEREYDIIVTSNILDYASSIRKLEVCCENLERHLKPEGIVVCSYSLVSDADSFKRQRKVFERKFDFSSNIAGSSYVYVKK